MNRLQQIPTVMHCDVGKTIHTRHPNNLAELPPGHPASQGCEDLIKSYQESWLKFIQGGSTSESSERFISFCTQPFRYVMDVFKFFFCAIQLQYMVLVDTLELDENQITFQDQIMQKTR